MKCIELHIIGSPPHFFQRLRIYVCMSIFIYLLLIYQIEIGHYKFISCPVNVNLKSLSYSVYQN